MTDMSQGSGAGAARERIIDAFMQLLAERRYEDIGLSDIALRAGVTLAEMRGEFSSTFGILAAQMKETDRKVLAGGAADMAEETPREKLFDVLMRRLEMLNPYKQAIRSLARSAACNPPLAVALNGLSVQSQRWMLTAADIKVAGPKGAMRAQGLSMLFACVVRTWLDDEDPGLARTMAALDRELSRGQRWSGYLDDLCCIPAAFGRFGRRPRRRRDPGDDPVAA